MLVTLELIVVSETNCLLWLGFGLCEKASLVVQMVKNLPTMWETQVRSLGWEDPLKKEMATHSSIFAWNSMDRVAWQIHVVTKSQAQLSY